MAKQEKEAVVVEENVESTTSTNTAFEENDYYSIETNLSVLRGEVVKIYDQELVVKPFRFDQNPMIRYHNGLSEPFLSEMIIGRHNIVLAKKWVPK